MRPPLSQWMIILVSLSVLCLSINGLLSRDHIQSLLLDRESVPLSMCYSMDGVLNNLKYPLWGSAGQIFRRTLYADYGDSYDTMSRMDISARHISNVISAETGSVLNEHNCTDWLWAFGQFIDHDIARTTGGGEREDIPVPPGDTLGVDYMSFSRTQKSLHVRNFIHEAREQVNHVTSYLDLSSVYGSSYVKAQALRCENGKMKTGDGNLMPKNFMVGKHGYLENDGPGLPHLKFIGGDFRSNEIPPLTALHTLFLREHNRLAEIILHLSNENSLDLSSSNIYYLARMINIWQYQSIIYHEYLPVLLGDYSPNLEDITYNDKMNAMISNEFATSVYRFGHSLVSDTLLLIDESGEKTSIELKNAFFNPKILETYGLNAILRGVGHQICKSVDTTIVEDLRSQLFGNSGDHSFDLAALNIQRSRDHGIPPYHKFYYHYNCECDDLSFESITDNAEQRSKLSMLYKHIHQIDPWVGLLSEQKQVSKGSQFGKTMSKAMRDTFTRLVKGDRCFHSHYVQSEYPKTTLREIILHNSGLQSYEVDDNVFYSTQ